MAEKIKFIITLGLVVILAVSVFINFQTLNLKKEVERERDQLKNENDTLSRKIEDVIRDRNQLQEKISILNDDINKISQEREDIQKRYEVAVKERDGLAEKLEALESDTEKLHEDLNTLTQEKQKLEEKVETSLLPLKNANAILKQQLKSLTGRKIKLESNLKALQEEKSVLEGRLDEMGVYLEKKAPKAESKEYIELPPIVVRSQDKRSSQEKGAEKKELEGRILDVNKENNFVVIDLGQESGVRAGDNFQVYRQGKNIATIETMQVRRNIAACDIKKETASISVGDTIR